MIQLLAVGGGVLAVLVAINLLLTFALIGRLRTLQETVANSVPARDPALPKPGEVVGRFETTTTEGEPLTDNALREGKTLVGFFTPGCRPCANVRQLLITSPPDIPLLAFVEGTPEDPEAQALGKSLSQVARVAFLTEGDAVTRAIKQAGYPTLVLVERGVVAASGHWLHEVLP